ncbi:MAG: hypothetical protein UR68_C0015G0014 [Candidatus Roizmanbacteria bacterium GW2011_GWA2_35_19]|uniref:Toxin YoeB n=1 Tax=Candidatus Roizmanbacteria bacterium GW2011_GWA2_35_19 TaxID=1618478 RepID=A0A0G0BSW7_9BACT|nr:MAG: hypothetical protein UR68_C0015G0014 [Candidatus Roizmanbacteria bacterium GW2011_GWA2_35_19]
MEILPLSEKVKNKIEKQGLRRKFDKQTKLLINNLKHPGLNIELLEPREYGIYSFRIDIKHRALFVFRPDKQAVEILAITLHYR